MADPTAIAAARVAASRPQWTAMVQARDAVGLADGVMLHAGPPFASADAITKPILNAAGQAAVYEGWAATTAEGRDKVLAGEISLEPAQDHDVVSPLAAAISPAMWMIEATDAGEPGCRAYALMNGGMPQPQFHGGGDDDAVFERIRLANDVAGPALAAMLDEPRDLFAAIEASVAGGDDTHGRAGIGTAIVRAAAAESLEGAARDAVLAYIDEAPLFFLNVSMAATKCMLMAGEGIDGASLITAAAGNGRDFGLKVSGLPERWFAAPATPPAGPLFDESLSACPPLGAVGDSAVIDQIGLGAMALSFAPGLAELMADYVPDDAYDLPAKLLVHQHAGLGGGKFLMGIDARKVVETGSVPMMMLGILDADGIKGLIGRGFARPPIEPYAQAVAALA